MSLSDIPNLTLVDLPIKSAIAATSLLGHVSHVVGVRAEKQVARSHARWVVALMKNQKAIRDISNENFPSCAVSEFSVLGPKVSVAVFIAAAHPYPARPKFGADGWAILINLSPEAICEAPASFGIGVTIALATAITSCSARAGGKRLPALFAYDFNGFCFILTFGHGVTSETGCKVSRLGRGLITMFEPSAF